MKGRVRQDQNGEVGGFVSGLLFICVFILTVVVEVIVIEVILLFIIGAPGNGGLINVMLHVGIHAFVMNDGGLFFGLKRRRCEGWLRLFGRSVRSGIFRRCGR